MITPEEVDDIQAKLANIQALLVILAVLNGVTATALVMALLTTN